MKLRPWQREAYTKCISWFQDEASNKAFLINAAPGSGKTIAACVIAKSLIDRGEIERVVVIAPRTEVVKQWSKDFEVITKRFMLQITGADKEISELNVDLCATWAGVCGLIKELSELCSKCPTLVICDEHHHAAIEAAWGKSTDSAFVDAKRALILTGTPIRSDGADALWLAYDDTGAILHPEQGTYTLTYGEAVDLGYCRPVTFHRHEGHFRVNLGDEKSVCVSSKIPAELEGDLKKIPALEKSLEFYRLACTPQFKKDQVTPVVDSYQGSMVRYACAKLDELRVEMTSAGGLVIAPDIEMAEHFAKLLEIIDGEKPTVVHSQTPNSDGKIQAFRKTKARWIVSVAMISEGVDIKRLRVLIYLPNSKTELAFRQAIGRVVRNWNDTDHSRAYVIMPSLEFLERYALKVEQEMSPSAREDKRAFKRCPICLTEVSLSATDCPECGHSFPVRTPATKACSECGEHSPITAENCSHCSSSFEQDFEITLDEALRTGAIIRGMDFDEDEVREGERISKQVTKEILNSGDQVLINLIRKIPGESFGRLSKIINNEDSKD